MAKFLVTSGSNFDPFTYDELVKPVERMQQEYDASQDAYAALNLEADAIRQYISDSEDDRKARTIYDNYNRQLQDLQEELWANGVTAKTRRGLSAARAGYADMARVQKAIESRQARSKEYWDLRRKDSSLVMGQDPGTYGLDNYLDNDNFGQDWYTYSGQEFMNEVGTDAKARADELLRDARVESDPELKGKLIRIKQEGFTSTEVQHAGDAVEAVLSGKKPETLTPEEKILADVLMSHLDSTGARDKVSPDEFKRLVQYGRSGLSQSIGKTQEQIIDDEVWKAQQDWYWWKKKQDYTAEHSEKGGKGNGSNEETDGNYAVHGVSSFLATPEGKDILADSNKYFYDRVKEPIAVIDGNGQQDVISNPYDAQRVLDTLGREDFLNKYGVDPDQKRITHKYDVQEGNGKTRRMSVESTAKLDDTGHYRTYYKLLYKGDDGLWKYDKTQSDEFNKDYQAYKQRIQDWKNKNNGLNIQNLVIKENEWDKIQGKLDLPDDIPREAYPAFAALRANVGERTPAYLADVTEAMEETRKNYANFLIASHASAGTDKKGNVAKTSDAVVYRFNQDGSLSEPITNLGAVLGIDEKSGAIFNTTLRQVAATPEDIIKGNIAFTANGSSYKTKAKNFGTEVNAVYDVMQQPIYKFYSDGSAERVSDKGAVEYMMKPLLDPVAAWRMDDNEVREWINFCEQNLGRWMDFGERDASRNIVGVVSPKKIILDEEYQGTLRSAVTNYINAALASPRDFLNNYKFKNRSESTSKPSVYNLGRPIY